ncbi:MAG: metal ABC transporter permease [Planctomycetota bacterium]
MSELWDSIALWHAQHSHLVRAALAGSLVSITCGVLGCFIILRRMAFLGDAIAHSMLAGVAFGYLLMKLVFGIEASTAGMLVGSLVAGLITVALIGFVRRLTRVKEDAAIGIIYTGVFALGGLLVSLWSRYVQVDLLHFVAGNLLAIEMSDLWAVAVIAVIVISFVTLGYRALQLTSFDPVLAASLGVPVVAIDYLLTTCTSLVVVSAVNVVGVILVVGLLVTPAATAYLWSDRLPRMLGLAALFAWTSFAGGLAISLALNVAPGSAIVVTSTGQFLISLALQRLLRRA